MVLPCKNFNYNWIENKIFAFIIAENTEEGFYNINDLDESFNGSLSDSEIIINCKHSKLKKINKINKIKVKRK
jgi:hypothetical protein